MTHNNLFHITILEDNKKLNVEIFSRRDSAKDGTKLCSCGGYRYQSSQASLKRSNNQMPTDETIVTKTSTGL